MRTPCDNCDTYIKPGEGKMVVRLPETIGGPEPRFYEVHLNLTTCFHALQGRIERLENERRPE